MVVITLHRTLTIEQHELKRSKLRFLRRIGSSWYTRVTRRITYCKHPVNEDRTRLSLRQMEYVRDDIWHRHSVTVSQVMVAKVHLTWFTRTLLYSIMSSPIYHLWMPHTHYMDDKNNRMYYLLMINAFCPSITQLFNSKGLQRCYMYNIY